MATSTLVALSSQHKSRTLNRGDLLPLWPDCLWKIEQGIVRTITWMDDGTLISLGYWGRGDVMGRPLSRLEPYQIECLTPVQVSLIPANQWPQEVDGIIKHLQQAEELGTILHSQRTEQRLLNFLLWLGKKFGRTVEGGQLLDLRLTHLEISDVIGTTRVSVTRMMMKLEQQGIIIRPRRHCVILAAASSQSA